MKSYFFKRKKHSFSPQSITVLSLNSRGVGGCISPPPHGAAASNFPEWDDASGLLVVAQWPCPPTTTVPSAPHHVTLFSLHFGTLPVCFLTESLNDNLKWCTCFFPESFIVSVARTLLGLLCHVASIRQISLPHRCFRAGWLPCSGRHQPLRAPD